MADNYITTTKSLAFLLQELVDGTYDMTADTGRHVRSIVGTLLNATSDETELWALNDACEYIRRALPKKETDE